MDLYRLVFFCSSRRHQIDIGLGREEKDKKPRFREADTILLTFSRRFCAAHSLSEFLEDRRMYTISIAQDMLLMFLSFSRQFHGKQIRNLLIVNRRDIHRLNLELLVLRVV